MKYRKFGQLDFTVSAMGLGTWVMGGWNWGGSEDHNAEAAIQNSLEKGITLIDTAPVYGFGRAEEIVGRTVEKLEARNHVIFATKFGLEWDDSKKNLRRNSSKKQLLKELDASRKRLRTDVIDIYQIHWPDLQTPFGETMEILLRFYDAGIIGAIGLSNFNVEQIEQCLAYAPVHALQPPYNLFEQESGLELIPFCREKGICVITYGALCRGLLSGKFGAEASFSEGDIRRLDPKFQKGTIKQYLKAVKRLENITQKKNCTVSQLAIAWAFHKTGVTSALAGARSGSQAENNAQALNLTFESHELEAIEKIVCEEIPKPISAGFLAPATEGYKKIS